MKIYCNKNENIDKIVELCVNRLFQEVEDVETVKNWFKDEITLHYLENFKYHDLNCPQAQRMLDYNEVTYVIVVDENTEPFFYIGTTRP